MKKSALTVYLSAHAAAVNSLNSKTPYDIEVFALADFQAAEQDPADWPLWQQTFAERRKTLVTLAATPAPSTAAATAAAAAAAKAAAPGAVPPPTAAAL